MSQSINLSENLQQQTDSGEASCIQSMDIRNRHCDVDLCSVGPSAFSLWKDLAPLERKILQSNSSSRTRLPAYEPGSSEFIFERCLKMSHTIILSCHPHLCFLQTPFCSLLYSPWGNPQVKQFHLTWQQNKLYTQFKNVPYFIDLQSNFKQVENFIYL